MQEIGACLAWQVFFLKKWGGGRGKGGRAESFLCAVSVPTEVLRLKALIKAKTFSKQLLEGMESTNYISIFHGTRTGNILMDLFYKTTEDFDHISKICF